MTDLPRVPGRRTSEHDDHQHLGHSHRPAAVAPRRAVRLTLAALLPAAILTLVAMVWLWPRDTQAPPPWQGPERVPAEVVLVEPAPCPGPPMASEPPAGTGATARICGSVDLRLTDGVQTGRLVSTDIPSGPGAPTVRAGDEVVLIYTPDSPSGPQYQIIDHRRSTQLWLVGLAFALAVVAFGRWRGLTALAGLAVTFAVLLVFVVPAILDGRSPLLVAIVGSAAIMLVVLYLTHGITVPTSMAVLGTLASLTLTGLLAAAATAAVKLTGVATEESAFLTLSFQDVNMHGLLLAGILIGSLGVLDDVAVTQAYTVTEIAQANPSLGFRPLYRAAGRVGRAHITSVINTIVLAYAGASLPLLLLLAAGSQPLGEVLTSELMAQEIVRSAVGTIGLIAAVPITTALAALAARPEQEQPGGRHRRGHLGDLDAAWSVDDGDNDHAARPRRVRTPAAWPESGDPP